MPLTVDTATEKTTPEVGDWLWLADKTDKQWRKIKYENLVRRIESNTTISVASSGGDYTTVGAALASLDDSFIESGVTVTISVAAGTFVEAKIEPDHPQSQQIEIVGAGSGSTTLSFTADGGDGVLVETPGRGCLLKDLTILSATSAGAGVKALYSAAIRLDGVVIEGFNYSVWAQYGGQILAESACTLKDTLTWYCAYAIDYGYLELNNCILDNATSHNAIAWRSGFINLRSATVQNAGGYGVSVADHGRVNVGSVTFSTNASGDTNLSTNTVATDGALIYS